MLLLLVFAGCADETPRERDPAPVAPRGYVRCGPHASGTFCDDTDRLGVREALRPRDPDGSMGSVTSADFDGDGRADLLVAYDDEDVAPRLWLNTAAGFVERAEAWGLASRRSVKATASADLDGDGDPDLLLRERETEGVQLLRNTGERFELVSTLGDRAEFTVLVPVDLDRDGMLDLTFGAEATPGDCPRMFINGCPAGVQAWRQVEPWRFERVAVEASPRRVLAMRWYDVDRDDRDELIVVADFGMLNGGNQVLRVEGAGASLTLREAPLPAGFNVEVFGMGIAPIDVDRDGRDELLITNFGRNVLLRSHNDRWDDVAQALGADAYGIVSEGTPHRWSGFDPDHHWMGPMSDFQRRYLDQGNALTPTTKWTPLVFDFDLDGVDDAFIGASAIGLSELFPEAAWQSGVMLRGDGARLQDVTDAVRLGEGHGVAHPVAVDLDGDGDLDLAMPRTVYRDRGGGLAILRNDTAAGRSLWIEARGLGAARDGIGARVRVVVGGRTITRRLDGNLSIAGSGPHGVFVGLGATPRVERVEVRFPSGAVRTVENVPPGRVVVSE
jgi:hypothetical protein